MQTKFIRFLENLIFLVIILVIIQTFLEDLAILSNWTVEVRNLFIVLGFVFDIIFTLEFFSRSIYTLSKGSFRKYFLEDNGWVDFLASIPLLLFNSGPGVFALLTGGTALAFGGILQVLKVLKAIRIARVLRLLRVLKIFKRIKNADALMTQRHITRIATTVVSALVIALLAFAVIDNLLNISDVYVLYEKNIDDVFEYVESDDVSLDPGSYFDSVPIVLLVQYEGRTLYSRYNDAEYSERWSSNDYAYVQRGNYELFIDIRYLNVGDAKTNIKFFLIIIIILLVLVFVYSPHFALTISDPIHVMRKGFDEPGYNLQVRIPRQNENDEIFLLAASFNKDYLPLKDREGQRDQSSTSKLSMDDLANFIEPFDGLKDTEAETDTDTKIETDTDTKIED